MTIVLTEVIFMTTSINKNVFLDTNIWIYFYSNDDKNKIAKSIIVENFNNILLSTQTLNELYVVLTRKKFKSKNDAQEIIQRFTNDFNVALIETTTIELAFKILNKYNLQYFDSLLLAAAIENGCEIFYSEDMQHNLLVDGKLKIINPFF